MFQNKQFYLSQFLLCKNMIVALTDPLPAYYGYEKSIQQAHKHNCQNCESWIQPLETHLLHGEERSSQQLSSNLEICCERNHCLFNEEVEDKNAARQYQNRNQAMKELYKKILHIINPKWSTISHDYKQKCTETNASGKSHLAMKEHSQEN